MGNISIDDARVAKAELQRKIDDFCTCANTWKKLGVACTVTLKSEPEKLTGIVSVSVEVE